MPSGGSPVGRSTASARRRTAPASIRSVGPYEQCTDNKNDECRNVEELDFGIVPGAVQDKTQSHRHHQEVRPAVGLGLDGGFFFQCLFSPAGLHNDLDTESSLHCAITGDDVDVKKARGTLLRNEMPSTTSSITYMFSWKKSVNIPALDVVAVIWMGAPRFTNLTFRRLPHTTCAFCGGTSIVLMPDRLKIDLRHHLLSGGISVTARSSKGSGRCMASPVIVLSGGGDSGSPRGLGSPRCRQRSAGYLQGSPFIFCINPEHEITLADGAAEDVHERTLHAYSFLISMIWVSSARWR